MNMKINNTIYNQTYQPVAQKSNAKNSTFSLPTQPIEAGNRFVTPPSSVLYEGLNL